MLRKIVWLAFVAMALLAIYRAVPHDLPGLYAMAEEYVPAVKGFVDSITGVINEELNIGEPGTPGTPEDGGTEPDPEPPSDAPEAP